MFNPVRSKGEGNTMCDRPRLSRIHLLGPGMLWGQFLLKCMAVEKVKGLDELNGSSVKKKKERKGYRASKQQWLLQFELEACHDVLSLGGRRLKQKARIAVIASYCGNVYKNR